jgi:hypothetical protein
MLSALIPSAGRKPAVPLAGQLAHESCVRPGPLVLGTAFLKSPTAATDRDRHFCYRYPPRVGARAFLPGSACRHAGRTISSPGEPGVRHMVSEDSGVTPHGYAGTVLHRSWRVPAGGARRSPRQSGALLRASAEECRRRRGKSCCFELTSGCASKKGITRCPRSVRLRTTNTKLVSLVPEWFSLITPHLSRAWINSRTDLRSGFWLTWNSGRSCQPTRQLGLRWMETEKLPSPSTKPAM